MRKSSRENPFPVLPAPIHTNAASAPRITLSGSAHRRSSTILWPGTIATSFLLAPREALRLTPRIAIYPGTALLLVLLILLVPALAREPTSLLRRLLLLRTLLLLLRLLLTLGGLLTIAVSEPRKSFWHSPVGRACRR